MTGIAEKLSSVGYATHQVRIRAWLGVAVAVARWWLGIMSQVYQGVAANTICCFAAAFLCASLRFRTNSIPFARLQPTPTSHSRRLFAGASQVGKWNVGMATTRHTPAGRGYNSSLGYFDYDT
jgi:hypothetical protein